MTSKMVSVSFLHELSVIMQKHIFLMQQYHRSSCVISLLTLE